MRAAVRLGARPDAVEAAVVGLFAGRTELPIGEDPVQAAALKTLDEIRTEFLKREDIDVSFPHGRDDGVGARLAIAAVQRHQMVCVAARLRRVRGRLGVGGSRGLAMVV